MAEQDAIDIVRQQVEAFNSRDLDCFLGTYATHAEVSGLQPHPIIGRSALRDFYSGSFQDSSAHCEVTSLMRVGERWVVAHENVSNSHQSTETIAMFEVIDDVITKAALFKAPPTPIT